MDSSCDSHTAYSSAVRRGSADRLVRTYPTELEALAQELNALVAHNQEVVERQLDLDIDPMTPVSRLSVAQMQLVEIGKALGQFGAGFCFDIKREAQKYVVEN